MTTINNLSVASSTAPDDKIPLWSNANGVTRALPLSVLDKRYVNSQEFSRALVFPASDFNPQTTLPAASARANKAFFFDANGNPVAVDLTILGLATPVVHSIAALRLVSRLIAVDAVVTGWYKSADGGGGHYCLDATDTTSTDNGFTIIVGVDGGRWKLSYTTPLAAPQSGALGDGTSDDSARFAAMEAAVTNSAIDLMGRTYLVSAYPSVNRYFNGYFLISSTTYSAPFSGPMRFGNNLLVSGDQAGAALPYNYDVGTNQFTYTNGLVALGPYAMKSMTGVYNSIAIGFSAMANGTLSFDNIALGEAALMNVSSNSIVYATATTGTRNIGIGGNAGQFTTTGQQNVFIGRDSGTTCVSTKGAVAIGNNALFGAEANGGWTAAVVNWWPNTNSLSSTLTAVGGVAAQRYTGNDITAIGGNAGANLTQARNCTFVGLSSGINLESNLLPNGHTQVIPAGGSQAASYVQAGNTITVTYPSHSAVAGQRVGFSIATGAGPVPTNGSHTIYETVTSVIDANTFTINCPTAASGAGTMTVYLFDTGVAGTACTQNTFVGSGAGHGAISATSANTLVGYNAGFLMDSSVNNTVVGSTAGVVATKMTNSALFGQNAGNNGGSGAATLNQTTLIGVQTGTTNVDGTVPTSYTNVSILGYLGKVSGDNQVQLGNSSTTTYVYGTVQNRSDLRDKADVRDTVLGLDFINALRPVDYKWDMREDYVDTEQTGIDADGNPICKTVTLPKDGSKTRVRYHHGLIAQEVQALIASTGVDFGGFQNHALEGGSDVLTIGYDELVAPLIKAVQQLSAEVAALKAAQSGTPAA